MELLACDFIKQVIEERNWWHKLAIKKSEIGDYETAYRASVTVDAMDKVIELYKVAASLK